MAGYAWPQFSIHRGYLQRILYDAVVARLGPESVSLGWQCTGFTDNGADVTAEFSDTATGRPRPAQRGTVLVGCDGVHSAVRKQLYPDEGEPRYSGVNMWRGVALWEPFLSGATFARVGWLATGKLVIYPIADNADGAGRQLVNWVAELDTPRHSLRDWTRRADLRTSSARSTACTSTGSTFPPCCAPPSTSLSTRWWTRTRSTAGASAG